MLVISYKTKSNLYYGPKPAYNQYQYKANMNNLGHNPNLCWKQTSPHCIQHWFGVARVIPLSKAVLQVALWGIQIYARNSTGTNPSNSSNTILGRDRDWDPTYNIDGELPPVPPSLHSETLPPPLH